ncbi:hypothetical protein MLD52_13130 [Puniceicoccaceae bacterium K14]|nr:hypothetical protein [Puniceicoccaceae bacterium K14]
MTKHIDLSSEANWTFREARPRKPWLPAIVPGCVHTDLLRAGQIDDPFFGTNELELGWIEDTDWDYRGELTLSKDDLSANRIELVADGLDTVATISVNGSEVARVENMFVGYRWDVGELLRPGRNTLLIRFHSAGEYVRTKRLKHRVFEFNDPVGGCTKIRKEQCQFGWDWGPRLVTAGIWAGLRLELWNENRLKHVQCLQRHAKDGSVTVILQPELARTNAQVEYEAKLLLEGKLIAKFENLEARVDVPELWWPNGHGAQPLYEIVLVARDSFGEVIGNWTRRIGLRTIELERKKDKWGESFQFLVNGRALFAKGANWIPAHSFVAGLKRESYERDLRAAIQANMNMIRVWGGGVYEDEAFYDLCDELGLLVWQDFMFACSLYPGDRAFQKSVAAEAEYQVKRLHDRACLALWCGNNEIFQLRSDQLVKSGNKRAYDALFHEILPEAVTAFDGATSYWPSSAWRGDGDNSHEAGERRGDTHFWDVWHARKPVKAYEKWEFRFCSEFGMQSYSSPETNATFCPPEDSNVFGPSMENHQKNPAGNQIILDYVSSRYPYPKNQDALILLSQLNQAHCMQTGVEHWRRNMPQCMGALYWQLNDCWPAASWSSIEFTGQWKALHFLARRFFAPALVSAHVTGEETMGLGNYRSTSVSTVDLYTVYDAPEPAVGEMSWELCRFDGKCIQNGKRKVDLEYGKSVLQRTLDFSGVLESEGRDNLYLRIALSVSGNVVSEESVFFTHPRFLALPRKSAKVALRRLSAGKVSLTFNSDVFLHRVNFQIEGTSFEASDNYFELYPGKPKTITVSHDPDVAIKSLRNALKVSSLVDTYE